MRWDVCLEKVSGPSTVEEKGGKVCSIPLALGPAQLLRLPPSSV